MNITLALLLAIIIMIPIAVLLMTIMELFTIVKPRNFVNFFTIIKNYRKLKAVGYCESQSKYFLVLDLGSVIYYTTYDTITEYVYFDNLADDTNYLFYKCYPTLFPVGRIILKVYRYVIERAMETTVSLEYNESFDQIDRYRKVLTRKRKLKKLMSNNGI
jgi:hypothetical protein